MKDKAKKDETITIPLHLARMLAAEKDDFKDPEQYEDIQALAKSLLRLLMDS